MDTTKEKDFLTDLRKGSESDENDDSQWPTKENFSDNSAQIKQINKDSGTDKETNLSASVKPSTVNNMNTNAINQFQNTSAQNEDLVPQMSQLNIRDSKQNNSRTKDLAFIYFFGDKSGNNNEDTFNNPNQENQFQHYQFFNKGPNPNDFGGKPGQNQMQNFSSQDNALGNEDFGGNNLNMLMLQKKNMAQGDINDMKQPIGYNINSQPFIPKKKQFEPNSQTPGQMLQPNMDNLNNADNQFFKLNYGKGGTTQGKFFVIKSVDESNIIRVRILKLIL